MRKSSHTGRTFCRWYSTCRLVVLRRHPQEIGAYAMFFVRKWRYCTRVRVRSTPSRPYGVGLLTGTDLVKERRASLFCLLIITENYSEYSPQHVSCCSRFFRCDIRYRNRRGERLFDMILSQLFTPVVRIYHGKHSQ